MTTAKTEPAADHKPAIKPDRLVDGIVVVLALNAVQRFVGLGRGIVFCQWLTTEQLGQWDLAIGFLATAAPVLVLGLPGSFGRYVEHYRQQGQLKTFLVRATLFSFIAATSGVLLLVRMAERVSLLIFGSSESVQLVYQLAGCVFVVVVFNYLAELFTALRIYRAASFMQLLNSVLFAASGIVALLWWGADTSRVVAAYTVAGVVVTAVALVYLCRVWRTIPQHGSDLTHGTMWRKLLPFAGWVWITNWLTNLFVVVDRYMLVHHGNMDPQAALEVVGQYHTSRIIPVMLLSIVMMLAAMLTPHLSREWESARRRGVSVQINLALKLIAIGQLAIAVAVMLTIRPVFGWLFDDKFSQSLVVIPWAMTYCFWFGLSAIANIYLWCAEKAKLGSLALAIGLATNVVLNLVLLPHYGLLGAVWATSVANFVVLGLVLLLARAAGLRVEVATLLLCLLPATLWLGPSVGIALLLGMAVLRGHLFSEAQNQLMQTTARRYWLLGQRLLKRSDHTGAAKSGV